MHCQRHGGESHTADSILPPVRNSPTLVRIGLGYIVQYQCHDRKVDSPDSILPPVRNSPKLPHTVLTSLVPHRGCDELPSRTGRELPPVPAFLSESEMLLSPSAGYRSLCRKHEQFPNNNTPQKTANPHVLAECEELSHSYLKPATTRLASCVAPP